MTIAGLATLIILEHSYPVNKLKEVPSLRYDIGHMGNVRVQTYSRGPPLESAAGEPLCTATTLDFQPRDRCRHACTLAIQMAAPYSSCSRFGKMWRPCGGGSQNAGLLLTGP